MEKYYLFTDLFPQWLPRNVCRVTVGRWIDAGTFPPPIRISGNIVAWTESSLQLWRASRPSAGEPVPVLWKAGAMPKNRGQHGGAPADGRTGRPRGSKVIGGKLVLPADVPATLAALAAEGE
jgi:hypothetical protein